MISSLNKKVKILSDVHKQVKMRFEVEDKDKKVGNIMEDYDPLKGVTQKIVEATIQNEKDIDSIRNQKKIIKGKIIESRYKSTIMPKSQFQKRLTEQNLIKGSSNNII